MKKNFYALMTVALFCLYSCVKKPNGLPLIKSEFFIDDNLSSISFDSFNSLWIGSENGRIYKFSNFSFKNYDLHEDVIYKVDSKIRNRDTLLWIATRNNGLQVWKLDKDDKPVKIKTYTISQYKNRYSPYDFIFDEENLYVATSFGLFKTNIDLPDADMELVVPFPDKKLHNENILYITHNISMYQDSLILGSTSHGLFSFNKKSNKTEFPIKDINIDYVSVYRDTIYALNEKYLFYRDGKNAEWKKIPQRDNAKLYYKNPRGFSFMFSSNVLVIHNKDNYSTSRIRNKFPLNRQSRNLILSDTVNQYTYYISSRSLWRIPFYDDREHENQGKDIVASCINDDEDTFYLTSKNDLYFKKVNSHEAHWIYTFNTREKIIGIDWACNSLLYYNSDSEIFRLKISDQWYKNLLNSPKQIFKSPSRIISTYSDIDEDSGISTYYIGTQAGLYYLDPKNKIKKDSFSKNVYVTSFFKPDKSEGVYYSTLNHGIFYKKKTYTEKIAFTDTVSFIKDFVVRGNQKPELLILTNKNILYKNQRIPVSSNSINKIVRVNDSLLLGLSNKGIYRYIISDDTLRHTNSFYKSLGVDKTYTNRKNLLIISDLGALIVSVISMKKINWIQFQDKVNIKLYLLLTLCIFLIIFILVKKYKLKKHKFEQQITQTRNLLDKLHSQIADVTEETSELLFKIKNDLNSVRKSGNRKDREQLQSIYNQIFSSLIIEILTQQKKQLKEINTPESQRLCKNINKMLYSRDIFILKNCIEENNLWITQYKETKKDIDHILIKLQNGLFIKGITDILLDKLKNIRDNFSKLNLSEIKQRKNESLAILYGKHSNITIPLIKNEIQTLQVSLENYKIFEKHILFIKKYLEEHYYLSDYSETLWVLLYNLKKVKKQIAVLSILKEINNLCLKYKKNIDYINKENSMEINKKIINNLYAEFNEKNVEIARKVSELFSLFFMYLPQPDLSLITDILKINNFSSQNAKVLVLLLADKKIKRTLIPGILDVYSNLNPIISRLINDRLKNNSKQIDEFKELNPFSVIIALLADLSK